jgi:hypothetical protein
MQTSCNPVFPARQVKLQTTDKPVTPFGGLVSFFELLQHIGLPGKIEELMPFAYTSPNAIVPAKTLVAFIISVVAGARRLAHTDWLRADKALHALLGIERFPGTDTVRNFFRRFSQAHIEKFWRPLWKWLLQLAWPAPAEGFSLDLDSTVFQRSGHQEGAKRGYNPTRPGRHSHHPLLAFLAEAPLVLHAWLRSGNTGTARGVVAFLTEALALMPGHWKLRTIRADSGFFENALLTFLEELGIPYIIVARLTQTVKRKAAGLATWTRIDDNYAWARFTLQLQGWSKPREFFAIRELVRENKNAVGRRLIEVDGYVYRVFVTNRQGDGAELWRDYNQRACIEQHIEELKNDLQADGFCMRDFYATESAFLAVCFTYNLLSLYQHASAPEQRKAGYRRPATLRAAVFIGGAILGNRGRAPVLYIAQSWGGVGKHKPLLENILQWPGTTSPKLPPKPPEPPDDGASEDSQPEPAASAA